MSFLTWCVNLDDSFSFSFFCLDNSFNDLKIFVENSAEISSLTFKPAKTSFYISISFQV
jgi:hypothetical protein